ncbi:diguanylate cyclase, partial [Candidatus Bipolaricaulota bacterium]|nr:diguanylate cyclase [Candidatus Bipolaricaulota bacterium]
EEAGIKAIQNGAQDYLIKGEIDSETLERSIRYAVERYRMERKYRLESSHLTSLLENIPDIIYFKNNHAEFVRVNQAKAEEVGEDRPDDLHGKTDFDYYPPEQARQAYQGDMKVINTEEPVVNREERHNRDGETYWLEATKVPRYDPEGNVVGMLGISRDITERKKAERDLNKERDRLEQLHQAVDQFQQCQTEKDLWVDATAATEGILGFDWCAFYCREGDQLVSRAAAEGVNLEELPAHHITEGLAGATYQRRETIAGEDLRKDDRASISEDAELRSYMSVPIGEVGVFQAASKHRGAFNQTDLELAEILAGHLREEVKRIRLEEELREQAIRDPLTELYNRRYFNEILNQEVKKSERYSRPIAFLMIDINRFKEINDRYSHQTGDRVLKEVARLLKNNVREADSVIRYGGDEFLIMLPETDGEASHTVARLREKLEEWNRDSDLLDFPLTLAIGSAHWSPEEEDDTEKVLKEADQKMYEDKREANNGG